MSDLYTRLAARALNIPEEEVTEQQRREVKRDLWRQAFADPERGAQVRCPKCRKFYPATPALFASGSAMFLCGCDPAEPYFTDSTTALYSRKGIVWARDVASYLITAGLAVQDEHGGLAAPS